MNWNLLRYGKMYVGCVCLNGMMGGHRHWHHNIYPELYLPQEKPLWTREVLDYAFTLSLTSLLNLPPPLFLFSMYRNAQRMEILWRKLDPNHYRFYYDQL